VDRVPCLKIIGQPASLLSGALRIVSENDGGSFGG
jgi:hypothetical protein